jgi:hypothetical protein
MVADQIVSLDDGTAETYPGVGELRYVIGFGHEHWHLMRLEAYQLISVADPSNVVNDKKTGFCLIAGYANDRCAQGMPSATSLIEGLLPGQSDTYTAFVEYQELGISPSTTPAGEYKLVHTANPDGLFHEKTLANNQASLLLDIRWPAPGAEPTITCPEMTNDACPGYLPKPGGSTGTPPPPAPAPEPAPESTPQQSPQPTPPAEPQTVPVVQDSVAIANALSKMTRAQATDLAKRAIRLTSKRKAKAIAASCARRSASAFSCRVGWTQSGQRWRGRVSVRYRVVQTERTWAYNVTAANTATGRHVQRTSARASSNLFMSRASAASLLCMVSGS